MLDGVGLSCRLDRQLGKPLSEWGKVLHDEDLAAAILDHVLERGRFIHLDGPSGRTRHLDLEEALPAMSDRVRISGNNGSEFPEPTQTRGRDQLVLRILVIGGLSAFAFSRSSLVTTCGKGCWSNSAVA